MRVKVTGSFSELEKQLEQGQSQLSDVITRKAFTSQLYQPGTVRNRALYERRALIR